MEDHHLTNNLSTFTDILTDESQPISLSPEFESDIRPIERNGNIGNTIIRPAKYTGQYGVFRSVDEIAAKYRCVFSYPFFNLVQSKIIEDALYSDKSMVVCAPTGSGKTVAFEMAIVQLLMKLEDMNYTDDFKIIYMAPVKAVCTERLTEWYPKFNQLGLLCIEVTGDTDVDFSKLKPYRIIITTPEKWDVLTRRWTDYRGLVGVIKLFLIDEVHILNEESRGPVLEAVVSRMKTIESSSQSEYRIEQLKKQYLGTEQSSSDAPPRIRFVAVSATVSNPEDVAAWLGNSDTPAVYHKYGDECRPVKLKRIVEGYPCTEGTSIFKFDIILNYKLWPIIQKYYNGKPTLIFCNTRKSVALTAETLSRELTISFNVERRAKLTELASKIKNKKLQALVMNGVGCHHAGLLYEERMIIEQAFRQRDLPILITTTTLAMGVNLPAHLVIIKNTQQYVNGAYQEYSISTVLQMVGRAGRPQFDVEATAVIMTRIQDKVTRSVAKPLSGSEQSVFLEGLINFGEATVLKHAHSAFIDDEHRYQSLVCGSEPLQSYLHKRLTENLNSEAALRTVTDVAQCVQWLSSTFLYVRAARDPKRYLGLPVAAPSHLIMKKIEELCVKAMNGLASSGLITMDEASCIESTEAGRLMSIYYLDFETMKHIMKIDGTESLERLLWVVCESHELAEMHLRVDERRCLNTLNRNSAAATIRFPMKGKISTRQMKINCVIQAILGCLPIPDPSLNQESIKIMRISDRICKCIVSYITRPNLVSQQPQYYSAILNSILLGKCIAAHLWENSPYVSKQLKGIGTTFSTLLATAAKVNFMVLEESHPRDLERIMNKGPPAGNVLRKQISLLPKYQLMMTPVDEKCVTIQLVLLNQSYLLNNMDQLTAGEYHKSYLIVGDSENHILIFISFTDKDLITIYDGIITQTLVRKHRFEHKVFVHCVSSSYVGIDVQCEYLYKDLEPKLSTLIKNNSVTDITRKNAFKKQTNITEMFKQRKRKSNEIDLTQSKEKKKRDNALIERFKILKKSFNDLQDNSKHFENITIANDENKKDSKTFQQIASISANETFNKEKKIKTNTMSDKLKTLEKEIYEIELLNNCYNTVKSIAQPNLTTDQSLINEINKTDSFRYDSCIDIILNKIESEISDNSKEVNNSLPEITPIRSNYLDENYLTNNLPTIIALDDGEHNTILSRKFEHNNNINRDDRAELSKKNSRNFFKISQNKVTKNKDNFSFIELLEKNVDFSDEEENSKEVKKSGFSETIKSCVQKYISEAKETIPKSTYAFEKYEITENWQNPANLVSNAFQNDDKDKMQKPKQNPIIRELDFIEKKSIDEIQMQVITSENNFMDEKKSLAEFETFKDFQYTQSVEENLHSEEWKDELVENKIPDEFDIIDLNKGKICAEIQNTSNNMDITNISDVHEICNNLTTKDELEANRIMNNNNIFSNHIDSNNKIIEVDKDNEYTDNSKLILLKSIHNFKTNNLLQEKKINAYIAISESPFENSFNNVMPQNNEEQNNIEILLPLHDNNINLIPFKKQCKHDLNYFKIDESNNNCGLKSLNRNVINNIFTAQNAVFLKKNIFFNMTSTDRPRYSYAINDSHDCNTETKNGPNHPADCQVTHTHYSYKSSEIDVLTKSDDSSECKLRIVKKITVDVDISKVDQKNTNDHRIDQFEESLIDDIKKNDHFAYNDPKLSEIHQADSYCDKINLNLFKTQNGTTSSKFCSETKDNLSSAVADNSNINSKTTKKNSIEQKKEELVSADVGKSAVDSLLKKHTNILKNKAETVPIILKGNQLNDKKKQIVKQKRPFRISDIDIVDAVLPKHIVEYEPPSTTISSLDQNDLKIQGKNDITEIKWSPDTQLQYNEEDLSTNLSQIIPTPTDTNSANKYDLHQTMLNPKTLLQCYNIHKEDKDNIIPPPPQFCDSTLFVKNCYNELLSNNSGSYDRSFCNESFREHSPSFLKTDPMSLERKNNTNLTCLKEVETWTLLSEDKIKSNNFLLSNNKTFTVFRKHPLVANNNMDAAVDNTERKIKLDHFKFQTKTKFKARR